MLFREAMKEQGKRNDLCSNPTEVKKADRGKAYTLDRLQRESPELFEQVKAGELSANAAAIKAGFRKRKTPLDQLKAAARWGRRVAVARRRGGGGRGQPARQNK